MIEYEYIDQYVHVEMLLTMVPLIIELDGYVMTQVLYCDAKENDRMNFRNSLLKKGMRTRHSCIGI